MSPPVTVHRPMTLAILAKCSKVSSLAQRASDCFGGPPRFGGPRAVVAQLSPVGRPGKVVGVRIFRRRRRCAFRARRPPRMAQLVSRPNRGSAAAFGSKRTSPDGEAALAGAARVVAARKVCRRPAFGAALRELRAALAPRFRRRAARTPCRGIAIAQRRAGRRRRRRPGPFKPLRSRPTRRTPWPPGIPKSRSRRSRPRKAPRRIRSSACVCPGASGPKGADRA